MADAAPGRPEQSVPDRGACPEESHAPGRADLRSHLSPTKQHFACNWEPLAAG